MKLSKSSSKLPITSTFTTLSKSTLKHKILLSRFTPTPQSLTSTQYFQNSSILAISNSNNLNPTFTPSRTQLPSISSSISCIKNNAHKSWSTLWVGRFQATVKMWFKYLSSQEGKWRILPKFIWKCNNLIFNPFSYKSSDPVKINKWPKLSKDSNLLNWSL